jgi:uncharacterized protein YkwD
MLKFVFLIIIAAVAVPAMVVLADANPSGSPPMTQQDVRKIRLGRILDLVNQDRREAGVPALRWSERLAAIARLHVADMVERNYFSHYSPEGAGPGERAAACGYRWTRIGENIAEGQPTSDQVAKYWIRSPEYRVNILNPDFTEMGVAYKLNSDGRPLWVQAFGRPAK